MTPEEQIQQRLKTVMRNLSLEMAAQGVQVDEIGCAFVVTWQQGAVSIEPATIHKPRKRRGDDA